MFISCIAIDDDIHSLENLTAYMDKLPDLKLIHTFTEPLQALQEISASQPVDIIFMDVEMPSLSGIELASLLRAKTRHLIFTTAHTQYAIDAFKVHADAYLLKPYSILHFAKTINNLYPAGSHEQISFPFSDDHFIYVPLSDKSDDLVRISLNELIAVEESGHQIVFKTIKDVYLSSRSNFIKTLKILKTHTAFISLNPNTIISKQHIKSVLDHQVLLSRDITYSVSASHLNAFKSFLKNNKNETTDRNS